MSDYFGFLDAQESIRARYGLQRALVSDIDPEKQARFNQDARTAGAPISQGASVSPELKAEKQSDVIDWAANYATQTAYQRRLGTPEFANLVKDDVTNTGWLESLWHWISGDPGKPEDDDLGKQIRNSVARGGWGLANSLPFGGNISQISRLNEQLNYLDRTAARIKAGESDAAIFGDELDPSGSLGRRLFDQNSEYERRTAEAELRRHAEAAAKMNRLAAMYPDADVVQEFNAAHGAASEAVGKFMEHPFMNLAAIVPSSTIQFAPAAAGLAVSGLTGPVAPMALGGLYSYGLDRNSTIASGLGDLGIDARDPEKIYNFFRNPNNPELAKLREKAEKHALPVAALDALSLGAAKYVRLPKAAPAWVSKVSPTAERVYDKAFATPFRAELNQLALQTQLQGAMGAAGEALGQVNSEGGVTSWSDVVAEFAGEFGTAPMEVGSMSVHALRGAQEETARAAESAAAVKKLVAVAKTAKIFSRDPQSAVEFLDEAVKDQPDEGAIYISAEALHQEGLAEKLAEVSPSARAQLQSAEQTGDEIRIPYSEFVTNVARSEIGEAVADHAHVSGLPSYHEAIEAERAIIQGTADQSTAAFEMKPQEFRTEIADIGKELTESLKAADAPDSQAKSYSALVQTLVGNMASDAGMSPRDVWESYGLRGIFSEGHDVVRSKDGGVQAVSDQAKAALTNPEKLHQDLLGKAPDKDFYSKTTFVPATSVETLDEAKSVVKSQVGTPFVNEMDGVTATVSNANLRKMTSASATKKSVSPAAHATAVANVGSLFTKSVRLWTKADRAGDPNILGIHRYVSLMVNEGAVYPVKLTVKEYAAREQGFKIYSVEAVEVENSTSLSTWAEEELKRDSAISSATTHISKLAQSYENIKEELERASNASVKEQNPNELSKGEYFPSARAILLWANADRSTFLHETGHWFLGARAALALKLKGQSGLTAGQTHLVESVEEAVKWLGYESLEAFSNATLEERRPAEERFARTFEQYLKDGRAPNAGLQSLFRRFANWLKAIYGFMTAVPGSQMSDDVRQIFDRLFVAEEAQAEARLRYDLYQALHREDFDEEAAYQAYLALMKESIDTANEDLTARGMRDMRYLSGLKDKILKNMTEQAKAIWRRLSDEEYDRYTQTKDYQTFQLLSEGEERDGKNYAPKISREEAKAAGLTAEELTKLENAEMLADPKDLKKGDGRVIVPGDALAGELGYSSLSELVKKMAAVQRPEDVAEDRARARMLEEYGEFSSEKRMKQAAAEAIFNPATARLLATEINLMEGNGEDRRVSVSLFRDIAIAQVGRTMLADLIPEKARRAAAALSRESRKYQTGFSRRHKDETGKTVTERIPRDARKAAELKRKELYQTVKAEELQKKRDEIRKRIEKLRRRFGGRKEASGVEGAYASQIGRLMAEWGFTRSNTKNELKGESYAEFAKHRRADAGEIVPELSEDLVTAPQEMGQRTVNQVEAQINFLEDLASLGKRSNEIRVNGRLQRLDNAVEALASEVSANAAKHGLAEQDNTEREGRSAKVKDAIRKIGLAHARIPSLLAAIAGGRFGKMFDLVVSQFDKAADKEIAMRSEAAKRLAKAYAPLDRATKDHKRVYHEVIDASVSRAEVLTMLLNLGTEANRQRLLDGSAFYSFNKTGKPWTLEQVTALIGETLTKEEIEAAQGVWDTLGMYGEDLRALESRVGHRPLELAKPQAVEIAAGGTAISLKGGYYPIAYDRKAAHGVQSSVDASASLQEAAAQRLRPYTDQTHAKARAAAVKEPLTLTARAGFEEIDSVIHDICFRELIADASRIFGPKSKLTAEIKRYWGADAMGAINEWLRDIAVNGREQSRTMDTVANVLRSNVSLASIGLNLMTALIQPIGMLQSVAVLGPEWSARGIASFIANPSRARKFTLQKSEMMADRMRTRFREVAEIQARAVGNVGSVKDKLQTVAYLPIIFMQMLVDIPTWLGAYNRALSDGNTDARAVAMADRTVIEAQGSGRLMDLSGVERGGAWSKLFTVFYTFFNTAYNIGMVTRKTDSALRAAFNMMLVMVLQPVVETFVREGLKASASGGKDDDDEWLSKTLRKAAGNTVGFNLGLLVGLREISDTVGTIIGGGTPFGYSGPGGVRKVTDALRLVQQINQGELDEGLVKALLSVIGEWAGLPMVPVNRAISGKAALDNGKTDNPLVLILGYSKN